MIQDTIRQMLNDKIKGLTWTVDYYGSRDDTGAVYSTGGSSRISPVDMTYRYPTYQVFIRSSDWDFAKAAAEMTYSLLHKHRPFETTVNYEKDEEVIMTKPVYVFKIEAMQEPVRLGDDNGVMEYSVNFDVTLSEMKGVITNG